MFSTRLMQAAESFLLVSLAVLLVWLGTINGAGLSPDSVGYIKIALRIAEGNIDQVGAHWPPLYPLLIAGGFTDSLFENTRWISIVSIGVFVPVAWLLVNQAVDQPAPWYLRPIALLLLIANTALLNNYWMAWSEGPFISLLTCAIFAYFEYIKKRQQRWFSLLVFLLALLPLLRYAGIAFVGAFIIAVYCYSSGKPRQRIYRSARLAGLSMLPVLLWLLLNYIWHGSTAERSFICHPISLDTLQQGLSVLGDWAVGSEIMSASVAYFLLLVGAARVAWKTADPLLGILVLIPCCYIPFLAFSISFIDAYTPLDHRILSPLFFPFILLLLAAVVRQKLVTDKDFIKPGIAILMLVMLLLAVPKLNAELGRYIRQGEGYAHKSWQYSPSLAFVQRLALERRIYTNSPEALLVHLGRDEKGLPALVNPSTSLLNEQFEQQIMDAKAELLRTNGVVILFAQLAWRSYLPSAQLLISEYGFELVMTTADGVILRVAESE